RAIREVTAVLPRKRHSLSDTLVDDVAADFGQPINVRFPRTKIAAFDCVVEQTVNAVAVVLIIFGGVNPTLGGDGVRAARRILIAKAFHPVAELAQGGCRRTSSQTGANHNYFELAPVVWINQPRVVLVIRPFPIKR